MCCRLADAVVQGAGRLWRLALIPLFLAGSPAMAVTAGAPAISQPDAETVLLSVERHPGGDGASQPLASRVRSLISEARESGDPRPLGRAAALLDQSGNGERGAEFHLLRATVRQSLHRFDGAVEDLQRAITLDPDNIQAWFARYAIARARGRSGPLAAACEALEKLEGGLVAASCRADALTLEGQPGQAWQMLTAALSQADGADHLSLHWARVTRADLAERLNKAVAGSLWRRALLAAPGDRYVRARLADWYVQRQDYEAAVRVTDGQTADDQMAVLRLIALEHLRDPAAAALRETLASRFREARRRGELLHKRALARYLLDVAGQPRRALQLARKNWREQRELPDQRLLERARKRTANLSTPPQTGEVSL